MAFWVVGGDSPLDATGRGGYVDSPKRRVSYYSEDADERGGGGGGGFPFDGFSKRARPEGWGGPAAHDEYRHHQHQHHHQEDLHQHHHTTQHSPHRLEYEYDHGHHSSAPTGYFPNPDTMPSMSSMPSSDSIQVKNLAFLVIRERSPTPGQDPDHDLDRTPSPDPPAFITPASSGSHLGPSPGTSSGPSPDLRPNAMERTESGLSISSDTGHPHSSHDPDSDYMLSDLAAARLVHDHAATFRRRWPDSQHSRILKSLINPKSRGADFPLDNDALRSIFSAANELFFANRLARRVAWDWSHPASAQYQSHIVGTTALRRSAALGGYETLIVLSSPILKDTKYNRRLLISTFLHEMIHSFLFVTCGLKARQCGGHTEGFRQIAEVIDEWVGKEQLRLRDMEADLERFRGDDLLPPPEQVQINCNNMAHNPSISSNNLNNNNNTRNEEWRQPERNQYLAEPQPRRHRDQSEWQWQEREGFWVRSINAPGSPYVY